MEKQVKWEKWIDPFITDADEFSVDGDDEEEDDDDRWKDSYEKMESISKSQQKPSKRQHTGPVMVGPMGIIPLNENNYPSKVYCFWMGHTNFDIDAEVAAAIEKTPGVESLDIFTRYRFRIAIGKAFLDTSLDEKGREKDPYGRAVLDAVRDAICPKSKGKQEKGIVSDTKPTISVSSLALIKANLQKKYKFWAILAMPDGQFDTRGAETKEEVIKNISGNTTIATSWE